MAVLSYKCPNCDGGLIFDPDSQKFQCEYCMSFFTQKQLDKINPVSGNDDDAQEADEKRADGETVDEDGFELAGYTCPSCGAEVVTEATTASTYCFYCQNPVVLSSRLEGEFKPDRLIPFKIKKDEAEAEFLKWASKKWFAPRDFFGKKQIEKMTGVYFPHWLVDSDVSATLDTTGKKVRTWTSGDRRYTETKTYQIIRDAEIHYEDITKTALSKANKKLVDGIHPYDEKDLIEFNMGYLSGFQAEKRDMEKEAFEVEIEAEIAEYSRKLLKDSASDYVGVSASGAGIIIHDKQWEYAMLPVWTVTYKAKNKEIYYYTMNGQTGKVCGKLPIDFKRLAILFGAIAVPLFGILTIGGYLL